ncbi:polyprenyl synthetase family protein [Granulicatella sp. 20925_1_45]|uniref:polyprenyl synthetase family protein n=1 Tax=Granulicatella sp. 20925_1_45 TaxID=3003685 RepID=UPI00352DBF39
MVKDVIQQLQQDVALHLTQLIEKRTSDSRLKEAMLYAVQSGGKRIRPLLTLAVGASGTSRNKAALDLACALEMIHTYSLIHDDLPGMDDDDLRRGRPTVHKAFDEATAILAGDALLTLAFEVAANANLEANQLVEAVKILSTASGMSGMISGQMKDIASEEVTITLEQMKEIHREKTGELLLAAVRLGNLFIDDAKMKEAFVSYATHFGLAFQIQNDLQDVCWTSEQTGKETGKDSELSKNTYPSLLGVEGAKDALASEISSCKRTLEEVEFTPANQQTKALLVEFLTYLEI